jgi:hypothetical protein
MSTPFGVAWGEIQSATADRFGKTPGLTTAEFNGSVLPAPMTASARYGAIRTLPMTSESANLGHQSRLQNMGSQNMGKHPCFKVDFDVQHGCGGLRPADKGLACDLAHGSALTRCACESLTPFGRSILSSQWAAAATVNLVRVQLL